MLVPGGEGEDTRERVEGNQQGWPLWKEGKVRVRQWVVGGGGYWGAGSNSRGGSGEGASGGVSRGQEGKPKRVGGTAEEREA